MNIAEVLQRKRPQRRSVTLLLEPGLAERHARLTRELASAQRRARHQIDHDRRDEVGTIEAELAEVQEAIDANSQEFILEAMGATAWADLTAAYPPTEEQIEEGWPYDPEAMGPPLLAATIVEPAGVDEDSAKVIWNEWSDAERTSLFMAAVAVNREVKDIPFSKPASERQENSERN